MKLVKKILSVFLAAVLCVTACAINVSAWSESDAQAVVGGKAYKVEFDPSSRDTESHYFKFEVSKTGILKLNVHTAVQYCEFYVYDKNKNIVKMTNAECTEGTKWIGSKNGLLLEFDPTTGYAAGKSECQVYKGTYYLEVKRPYNKNLGDNEATFMLTLPGESETSITENNNTSSGGTNSGNNTIVIHLEVGDKLSLGAMIGEEECSAKWTSSNKKVCKVSSKGRITALKVGRCKITWKSGSSTFTFIVEVE